MKNMDQVGLKQGLAVVLAFLVLGVSSCRKPMRGEGQGKVEEAGEAEKEEVAEKETETPDEKEPEVTDPEDGAEDGEGPADAPEISGIADVTPEREDMKNNEPLTLPVNRVFRDKEGRELDAQVIGRNSLNLTVIRQADGTRFDLPIDSLSVEDQAWARTLAFQAAPAHRQMQEGVAEVVEEPPYITSRLEQIARLEEKIRRLEVETKNTANAMIKRSNQDRIKAAEAEIKDMKADISLYEARTGGRP